MSNLDNGQDAEKLKRRQAVRDYADDEYDIRKVGLAYFDLLEDNAFFEALLEAALDSAEDITVRKLSIAKLGYQQGQDIPFVEPLLELLANNLDELGEEIIRALGYTHVEGEVSPAVMPLIELLGHPRLGGIAVIALGQLKDERAVEPLFNLLNSLPFESFYQFETVEALVNLGAKDEQLVTYLISFLLDQEQDRYRRHTAATLLGHIGNKRAFDPLLASLEDFYPSVRTNCAVALGRLGDVRAVEPIIKLLKDPDDGVRDTAATALGYLGDKRAIEPLTGILGDKSWNNEVHKSAVKALERIRQAQPEIR